MSPEPITTRYQDAAVAFGTMHGKEGVVAPVLLGQLGLKVVVPDLNTDVFGTFTGEKKRAGSQLEAARQKARKAMKLTGLPLGMASEGSFNPDSIFPFITKNIELLLFIDDNLGIEVEGVYVSRESNAVAGYATTLEEAKKIAHQAGFPNHGMVVRPSEKNWKGMRKGLTSWEEFEVAFTQIMKSLFTRRVYVHSDMRAFHNPTRMKVIRLAAEDLVRKLQAECPGCKTPGYGVIRWSTGLPCALCGLPTEFVRSHTLGCLKCDHTEEVSYPDKVQKADPSMCGYCNP